MPQSNALIGEITECIRTTMGNSVGHRMKIIRGEHLIERIISSYAAHDQ
jgi:hypothetical protein